LASMGSFLEVQGWGGGESTSDSFRLLVKFSFIWLYGWGPDFLAACWPGIILFLQETLTSWLQASPSSKLVTVLLTTLLLTISLTSALRQEEGLLSQAHVIPQAQWS
jgi:hypothetical protein